MGPVIVEVIDSRGRVRQRVRTASFPVTIGRGYASDIVVDDPYVDPTHLEVGWNEAGELVATDRGSANGTWTASQARVAVQTVKSGSELKIGRTTVRFLAPDHPVPAALVDRRATRDPAGYLLDTRTNILVLLGFVGLMALIEYIGSTKKSNLAELMTSGLVMILMFSIWAGAWAFATRIMAGRFRFLSHLALVTLVGAAFLVLGQSAQWVGFLFPAGNGLLWLEYLSWAGLLAILVSGHLWLATEMPSHRRWWLAAITSGALLAIAGVFALASKGEGAEEPLYAKMLKPLAAPLIPSTTADRFIDAAAPLKAEVDKLAVEHKDGQ